MKVRLQLLKEINTKSKYFKKKKKKFIFKNQKNFFKKLIIQKCFR